MFNGYSSHVGQHLTDLCLHKDLADAESTKGAPINEQKKLRSSGKPCKGDFANEFMGAV